MTTHTNQNGHDDFPELDTLLTETMSGILTKVEDAFDPGERLGNLLRRTADPAQSQNEMTALRARDLMVAFAADALRLYDAVSDGVPGPAEPSEELEVYVARATAASGYYGMATLLQELLTWCPDRAEAIAAELQEFMTIPDCAIEDLHNTLAGEGYDPDQIDTLP